MCTLVGVLWYWLGTSDLVDLLNLARNLMILLLLAGKEQAK